MDLLLMDAERNVLASSNITGSRWIATDDCFINDEKFTTKIEYAGLPTIVRVEGDNKGAAEGPFRGGHFCLSSTVVTIGIGQVSAILSGV